ncbi:MAG: hypothetical protein HFG26_11765 [Provencibacterium sp.]|jgi:hypothetical protein|nr:hypothetical protein [Provencibacterium sp.]
MFGKKRAAKRRPPRFQLTDPAGVLLFEGELQDIPLREEMILQKSIEFFDDPSPCYIHRGAVMNRLYMELEDALSPLGKGERMSAGALGEQLCSYLQDGGRLAHIRRLSD